MNAIMDGPTETTKFNVRWKGRRKEIGISIIVLLLLGVALLRIVVQHNSEYEEKISVTNASLCTRSVHIVRRLYFHVCSKENKTVYDIRYFWKDDDGLKPSIIGIQLYVDEFNKICNNR